MLNHRGEIFRKVVDRYCDINKATISGIASRAGYDQSTIYRHFAKKDLSYGVIRKYGKVMNHDFSAEFPEMEEDFHMVSETAVVYGSPNNLEDCIKERDYYQKKYIELLEKHNEMLTTHLQKPPSE